MDKGFFNWLIPTLRFNLRCFPLRQALKLPVYVFNARFLSLKGKVSRPERKFYIDKIIEVDPRYAYLYQIRPGVMSYATLKNGYTDSLDKMLRRLEFDLYYLRHRSWWFDIKILFNTFTNIVFGKVF
ncbi:MAG: sugar transferase [Bacteroidales bacterium]|nr:sugar transferase [Bacteroidales bacterium]